MALFSSSRPGIRGRVLPKFPAQVLGGDGITVTKANGIYTISVSNVPVEGGGTGLSSGTSGGILGFTSTTTLASSALLAQNQIVLGGGAGATPATLGSLGTSSQVLHGNASGAPSFSAVSLALDVTGTLGVANGGTGITSTTAQGQAILALDSTAGLVAITGAGTAAQRTITGTANEVTVTNGSGASGNPTLSLPTALTFTGKTVTGGAFASPTISNASLSIDNTSTAFELGLVCTDGTMSANRNLVFDTLNGTRTVQLGGNVALSGGFTISGSSGTLTETFTGSPTVALGAGGTVAYTSNNLSVFAATTSAQLAGVISDETGSGALVFGTAPTITTINLTGGQIAFPATQSASADANTLDDYEEGTFTPGFTFGTPGNLNVVLSTATGSYTKIGRMVIATFTIASSTFTHTTASGNALITGLPFTVGAVAYGNITFSNITKANYTNYTAQALATTTNVGISAAANTGAAAAAVTTAEMASGTQILLAGTVSYHV